MNPLGAFFNIVVPVVILLGLSSPDRLGPITALILAVLIPAAYGTWQFARSRVADISALLGVVSVLLTGVIGVFELSTRLYAVKEAAIPLGFAAILLISNRTRYPVVTLLADMIQRRDRVRTAIEARGAELAYHRHIVRSGRIWAAIMALSGALKFLLSSLVVNSPAGTQAFNEDLARYELVQLPTTFLLSGILILSLIWYIVSGTGKLAGLQPGEILRGGERVERVARRFAPIARLFGA